MCLELIDPGTKSEDDDDEGEEDKRKSFIDLVDDEFQFLDHLEAEEDDDVS